ncbi:P-loop containing nucleoside triphosphate hydrolase protein [Blyttiomyces helicus]|uniref:P-loop containing nucleoside triphosphate hydrolase protein n=1 Tax=Blyttiomyces helicus TaxID=388810 RepID=A0A4V1IPG2_9FUNG|nr:P-loop containing nucleoside triphosphate hydrolase protein [Blyttiomyces helicus]|eukprot:RKO82947.1 P-loop containing nucleoside triphosphate hydrolase protein [Blyttiomyces helicus]
MLSHELPPDIQNDLPTRQPSPPAEDDDPPPTPRLVISTMVLRNFKSYAGVVEIGPFHKSFTSVVGPNGSGKSNVIDSLLFVFGFKAKKMRQGKLSELIHHSANYPDLQSCSVEVHFEEIIDMPGTSSFRKIPNSELVISRTVERGPTEKAPDKSTYRVNGRNSSFTEVTTLLMGKGVDLQHKRFLILQGEVESIALMKPKAQTDHEDGLLEYLEDIIGTSSLKQPIEDASKQLDLLNEERAEKLNRLKIVEKDKNSLQSRKDEAEAYIHTENELARKQNSKYQFDIAQCTQNSESLVTEVATLTARYEEERQKCASLAAECKALEKTFTASTKEYNVRAWHRVRVQGLRCLSIVDIRRILSWTIAENRGRRRSSTERAAEVRKGGGGGQGKGEASYEQGEKNCCCVA